MGTGFLSAQLQISSSCSLCCGSLGSIHRDGPGLHTGPLSRWRRGRPGIDRKDALCRCIGRVAVQGSHDVFWRVVGQRGIDADMRSDRNCFVGCPPLRADRSAKVVEVDDLFDQSSAKVLVQRDRSTKDVQLTIARLGREAFAETISSVHQPS